jgi:hypothetical protein
VDLHFFLGHNLFPEDLFPPEGMAAMDQVNFLRKAAEE